MDIKQYLEENNLEQTVEVHVTKPALFNCLDKTVRELVLNCVAYKIVTKEKATPSEKR